MAPDSIKKSDPPAVLVVDDEAAVRDFIRIALMHAGFSVSVATSAKQALEVFLTSPDRYDLVLTDVRMPGRSGVELATDISATCPSVPVVFMSGFTGGTLEQPITLPDGAKILEKPFTLDGLIGLIRKSLSGSL